MSVCILNNFNFCGMHKRVLHLEVPVKYDNFFGPFSIHLQPYIFRTKSAICNVKLAIKNLKPPYFVKKIIWCIIQKEKKKFGSFKKMNNMSFLLNILSINCLHFRAILHLGFYVYSTSLHNWGPSVVTWNYENIRSLRVFI